MQFTGLKEHLWLSSITEENFDALKQTIKTGLIIFVRIGSKMPANLPNVAFKIPGSRTALIVVNEGAADQTFGIRYKGKILGSTLKAGAVGTYVW